MFSLLIIGNEILSGSIPDTNLAYMFKRLRELNMPVDEVRVVPDHMETIIQAIDELRQKSTYVISSGGIGPTHDDLTLPAYAELFNVKMVENQEMKQRVERFFGRNLKAGHRYLYQVPEKTEILYGNEHTWPVYKLGNCFILPGLPEVFVKKFELLVKNMPAQPVLHKRQLGVNVSEGFFAEELRDLQARYTNVEIGSYPLFRGSWDKDTNADCLAVRITFQSADLNLLQRCFNELEQVFLTRNWLFPIDL